MKCTHFRAISLCAAAICVATDLARTEELPAAYHLPFLVEAGADVSSRFPGAPRLHSFAWAEWQGKWIFLAGRTAGYHGVGGAEADFSRASANDKIWVVDPAGEGPARTYSFPVADLPASLDIVKNQWMSSNTLFFQDRDTLYLAGGYGQNTKGAWVTHGVFSAVSLPALVEGVMHGHDTFSRTIAFAESPVAQVSGGEMLKLDDGFFYIVAGHVFTGTYRDFEGGEEKNTASASQTYTGEIRKIRISIKETGKNSGLAGVHGNLSVALVDRYTNPEFLRRDLNVAFRILADGHSLGAAAYGGVFTKDQLGFTKPIFWSASARPEPDDRFEQKMSAYTCARMLFFDPETRSMLTTFFGGISGWTWNYEKNRAEPAPRAGAKSDAGYFDGLAWIDHITTILQKAGGTFEITDPSHRLPAYLGANAVFLPAPGLVRIREDADVYDLAPVRGRRVLVGYLYGGIRAFPREFPYHDDSRPYRSGAVPTKASDMIVPIYVTVPGK